MITISQELYISIGILVFLAGISSIGYYVPDDTEPFGYLILILLNFVLSAFWPWVMGIRLLLDGSWGLIKLTKMYMGIVF